MNTSPTVLASVDLGSGSQHVVTAAADIARSKGASLVLLHVMKYEPQIDTDFPLQTPDHERQALAAAAREKLNTMAVAAGAPRAEVRVVDGLPETEVPRVARELQTDLVVVGSWRTRLAALFGVGTDAQRSRGWQVVKV